MLAEMEQRKAENLILHHDEIHSRAPRTWIVSEAQKQQSKGWYEEYILLCQVTLHAELSRMTHEGKEAPKPVAAASKKDPKQKVHTISACVPVLHHTLTTSAQ